MKNKEDYATVAKRVEKRLIAACSETEINKEDIVNITDFDTAVQDDVDNGTTNTVGKTWRDYDSNYS